jgi:hypothetical protein
MPSASPGDYRDPMLKAGPDRASVRFLSTFDILCVAKNPKAVSCELAPHLRTSHNAYAPMYHQNSGGLVDFELNDAAQDAGHSRDHSAEKFQIRA